MALYKISSSRVNNIEATEYAGGTNELGLIWYDEVTGALRLYTGLPGGQIINGNSGGTPGGANTQVQFNNNGTFGGSANLIFDSSSDTLRTGSVTAVGNITTDAYFIGDGSKLTGIPAGYGNSNVVSLLSSFGNNTITTTGNITVGNVNTSGNIIANYILGNGSQLTGLPESYGNANVTAFLPTYTGNLASLQGNVTTTANIAGSFLLGNGAFISGLPAGYSNAEVATFLASGTNSSNITTTANIAGSFLLGNGAFISGLPANYGNTEVAAFLPTYTGNLVSLTGNVITTANISANFFIGDGSQLTGITAQGLPTQNGNAGLFLSTDGSNVFWNGALGSSLTFSGGQSGSDEFGSDLNGGAANDNFIGSTNILGGTASSDYNLTLSSVALTGQAEDVIISSPPLATNSVGSTGQVAFDPQWLYICISNNNWKRAALASW
jgi:hypothetical protein